MLECIVVAAAAGRHLTNCSGNSGRQITLVCKQRFEEQTRTYQGITNFAISVNSDDDTYIHHLEDCVLNQNTVNFIHFAHRATL